MKAETGVTASLLSIFTSASTLICCALPALFVALGAGATLASLLQALPQLVWLSAHKLEVFTVAATMLIVAGWLQWRARHAPCPIDPALRIACLRGRSVSAKIYFISVAMFAVGAFVAFVAPRLTM